MQKSRRFLAELQGNTFMELQSAGFFADTQRQAVEENFLPWIMGEVNAQLGQLKLAQDTLDRAVLSSLTRIRESWPAPKPRAVRPVTPAPAVPVIEPPIVKEEVASQEEDLENQDEGDKAEDVEEDEEDAPDEAD
jgi:hypothetical protein